MTSILIILTIYTTNYSNYLHYGAWRCKVGMTRWENGLWIHYSHGKEGKV
ncbi:hypothetical protein IC582_003426 [Cucumis melo]